MLSSWNLYRRRVSENNTSALGSIFLLRLRDVFFTIHDSLTFLKNPTPEHAMHPNIMTQDVCFSVWSMHSGFHSSPDRLLRNEFPEWLPTSNFDSSEHNTPCHWARAQFLWACAQSNRWYRYLFVSRGFLQSRQPFSPLSTGLWRTVLVETCTPVDSSQSLLSGGLERCLSAKDSLSRVQSSLQNDILGHPLHGSSLMDCCSP